MSIRNRTETARLAAGLTGAGGLGAAAAVHAAWGVGSTWPAASSDELADLVVGKRPMPGPAECAAVVVLLSGAAATTSIASVGRPGPIVGVARRLASIASGVLLLRGAGGLAFEVFDIGDPAPEFRRWNRRLYSPLCLVLGALIAVGVGRRP